MGAADGRLRVLIGVVGYSPLIETFPLGPRLMRRLETEPWQEVATTVENMTWSPLHIVQRFQDGSLGADRLVLVGASDVCREPGRIACHHWQGGSLPPEVLQERMYEAVTGIVSLDNTLMIGEHFGVWPDEVLTVELEMWPQTFGEIVMAEAEGAADRAALLTRLGFDPIGATDQLAQLAIACAKSGATGRVDLEPKSAGTLVPHPSFSHTAITAGA